VLDVGDPEPVLERLVRVAVCDTAGVAVRPEEAEPDRELAKEIEEPVREKAGTSGRGGSGHGRSF
jgi:hypothetical protein